MGHNEWLGNVNCILLLDLNRDEAVTFTEFV